MDNLMGARRERRVYRLTFADGSLTGLEVRAHGFTVREYLDNPPVRELLGKNMISWNRTAESGEPVPAGLDALLDEEPQVVKALCDAYINAVLGISAPLPPTSGDGQPFPEVSIPMAIPSESPTS